MLLYGAEFKNSIRVEQSEEEEIEGKHMSLRGIRPHHA